ncbi:hypothetical protein, conserved [Eimeria necatrix]|uniref:Uncharacterized protein n=1 Tax=Eimeria necatrix TaxID=51315 RepID=U6MVY9_9EIME|nr:hypothetical protein, conserved [Eimeria necatrix]CDJ68432.1 hypothetical protein, conserved [Eimeria necatrix]
MLFPSPSKENQRQKCLEGHVHLPLARIDSYVSKDGAIPLFSSFPGQSAGTALAHAGTRRRSSARRWRWSTLFGWTARFLVFAIVMFWSICKASRSTKQASGGIARRLSYGTRGGDEEMARIVEQCIEMEEDLGISASRSPSPLNTEPSAKIARLVSMLSEAATAYERMTAVVSTSYDPSTVAASYYQEEENSSQQALGCPYFFQHESALEMLPHTSSLLTPIGNSETSPAPNLWPYTCRTMIPGATGTQGGQGTASATLDNTGKPHFEPSTSLSLEMPPPLGGRTNLQGHSNILQHPYVSRPVLESNVVPRLVQPAVIFRRVHATSISFYELHRLRNLFAKERLNQQDADLLVGSIENLAARYWSIAQRGMQRTSPAFANATLGAYFLAFDFIVRAIEVLGDSMQLSAWWGKFVSAFKIDYSLFPERRHCRVSTKFQRELANRLLGALKIYITGRAPPAEDVVELKRMLFFSPHAPPVFKNAQFEEFRDQDDDFSCKIARLFHI